MNVLISLNGLVEYNNYTINAIKKFQPDYIICADGGTKHILNLKLNINMIVGDMDSIGESNQELLKDYNITVKKFRPEKDETDGEIAVLEALKLKPSKILIIGATGGRIDHQVANLHLLHLILSNQVEAEALGENYIVKLIDNTYNLNGKKGDTVSIFPFGGEASGITLIGFKYPLNNAFMKYGKTIGISNVMEEEECKVMVNTGKLLVIHYEGNFAN